MSDAPRPAVPGGTGRGGPEVPQDARGEAAGVLVVGFGNPLRRDDGVGPAVAELVAGTLAADPRLGGAAVLAVHQLTPDLAVDLATARRAIFVDATVEAGPGEVVTRRVAAGGAAGSGGVAGGEAATGVAAGRGGGPSSHHVGVDALLRLAAELYGQAPPATIVSVGVADLEVGEGLSSAVAAAVPRAVEAVLAAMTEVAPASVDAAGTSPAA